MIPKAKAAILADVPQHVSNESHTKLPRADEEGSKWDTVKAQTNKWSFKIKDSMPIKHATSLCFRAAPACPQKSADASSL